MKESCHKILWKLCTTVLWGLLTRKPLKFFPTYEYIFLKRPVWEWKMRLEGECFCIQLIWGLSYQKTRRRKISSGFPYINLGIFIKNSKLSDPITRHYSVQTASDVGSANIRLDRCGAREMSLFWLKTSLIISGSTRPVIALRMYKLYSMAYDIPPCPLTLVHIILMVAWGSLKSHVSHLPLHLHRKLVSLYI